MHFMDTVYFKIEFIASVMTLYLWLWDIFYYNYCKLWKIICSARNHEILIYFYSFKDLPPKIKSTCHWKCHHGLWYVKIQRAGDTKMLWELAFIYGFEKFEAYSKIILYTWHFLAYRIFIAINPLWWKLFWNFTKTNFILCQMI